MKKVNILVVLPWIPSDLNSGGNQAMFNGLKAVSKDVNLYITAYIRRNSGKSRRNVKHFKNMLPEAVFLPYYDKIDCFHKLIDLMYEESNRRFFYTSIEHEISRMLQLTPKPEDFLQYINKLIDIYNISIVQTEMLQNLTILCSCPSKVKKLFVHHELGYVRNELFQKNHNDLRVKAPVKIAKAVEIALLNECDAVMTLSEVDKEKLICNGVKCNIHSSFAIVNEVDSLSNISIKGGSKTLSFVGPEGHAPNKNGLFWFLKECWPLLQRESADWKLKIIGNWTEESKRFLCKKYPNLIFTGFVNNLYEELNGTTMIVPIAIGSGIRMKILEAANNNIPFVTTNVGVEGLPFENGKHCFIADEPELFSNAVLELEDIQLRQKFAQEAKKVVCEKYSIEALRRNRLMIYESIMK